jgi:hypothetical protein
VTCRKPSGSVGVRASFLGLLALSEGLGVAKDTCVNMRLHVACATSSLPIRRTANLANEFYGVSSKNLVDFTLVESTVYQSRFKDGDRFESSGSPRQFVRQVECGRYPGSIATSSGAIQSFSGRPTFAGLLKSSSQMPIRPSSANADRAARSLTPVAATTSADVTT